MAFDIEGEMRKMLGHTYSERHTQNGANPAQVGCAATEAVALLREWYSTYGGSTTTRGKPVDKSLDERTEAFLGAASASSQREESK